MMKIVAALGGVALSAILGIAWIWHFRSPKDMDTEIAKSLLSVLTATVVTQAIAIVVYQYNESRKAQLERDALKGRMLDRVNGAFIKVKALRRKARALSEVVSGASTEEVFTITNTLYQDVMEELNDVQLELEMVHKDVETNAGILKHGKEVFLYVRTMEQYLNGIVDEWEHLHVNFEGDPPKINAVALPKLLDLIGPYKTSQFRPKFVKAYYKAIENLRASMTDGQMRQWQIEIQPDEETQPDKAA